MSPRTVTQLAPATRVLDRARRVVLLKRILGWLMLAIPGASIAITDWLERGEQLRSFGRFDTCRYWAYALFASVLWGCILHLALQRRTKTRWLALGFLVLGAIFAVGAQIYTFSRYQSYLDHRAVLVGTSMMPSIKQQLWSDRFTFLRTILPPVAIVVGLALFAKKIARPEQGGKLFAMDVALVCLVISLYGNVGEQAAPPDVLYLSAMGQLSRAKWDHNETVERTHPGTRTPRIVAPLVAQPPAKRNVVFIITESVRGQSVCSVPEKDCRFTPFSNTAAPNRIGLQQMRAMDSTTAISLAIMWTGLLPTESRAELHSAPLLWEYLAAAKIHSSYWTSQNLLFGNSGTWLDGVPIDRRISATQYEPDATMEIGGDDGKLVDFALSDISKLEEPYVAVVHLSNTHFPYKTDEGFTPADLTGENELLDRYHQSIYLQDYHVARLIKGLRARPESDHTVLVFTSDHGEQLREKGAVGHTDTLWDEEIRIPFWIDAPQGTLTDAETKSLRALESTPLFSIDILPTVLDLAGLWDAPNLADHKRRMHGESLMRGGSPDRALAITNCTELWACAFPNWGAMRGKRKLVAQQWQREWGCYDLETDPEELHDLGPAACSDLVPIAERERGRPFH